MSTICIECACVKGSFLHVGVVTEHKKGPADWRVSQVMMRSSERHTLPFIGNLFDFDQDKATFSQPLILEHIF